MWIYGWLGGEFEKSEDKNAKWEIGWDGAHDAMYFAAIRELFKLSRIKKEKLKLLERIEAGGRKRNVLHPSCCFAEYFSFGFEGCEMVFIG